MDHVDPRTLTRSNCREIVLEAINRPLSDNIEDSCEDLPTSFRAAAARHRLGSPRYHLPRFEKLSEALGGFAPGGVTLITGGTGLGKSTLIGNIWVALHSLRMNGYTVPIEIGKDEFLDMLVSIVARVSRRKMRVEDYEQVKRDFFATHFSNTGHVIAKHDHRLSHLDFLAEVYYHHKVRQVRWAIGDNWNFMQEPVSGKDANAASDKALHDIITFSKVFPVHIWMIMHPRKDSAAPGEKKNNRVSSLDDIKGSSTSPQEAANVLLFNALEDAKHSPPMVHVNNCREILVAKARFNGRSRGSKIIYHIDDHSELYHEGKLI